MKEVIYAKAYGDDDYIHCCRYEKTFEYLPDNPSIDDNHKGGHFEVIIFTTKKFDGRVRITIESVEESE